MGNKRPYPDHLGAEFFHIDKILSQVLRRLIGGTHHTAASCLIPNLYQILETALSVFKRQLRGMQLSVMDRIGCFMAKKVSIRPRSKKALIGFSLFFSQKKASRHNPDTPALFQKQATPSGHPSTKDPPLPAAQMCEIPFHSHTGSRSGSLPKKGGNGKHSRYFSGFAVVAVIFAVIGNFYQPAEIHFVSKVAKCLWLWSLLQHKPCLLYRKVESKRASSSWDSSSPCSSRSISCRAYFPAFLHLLKLYI